MLLKLLALGGLGYAGYRYYEKNRVDKNGVAFADGQPEGQFRDAGAAANATILLSTLPLQFPFRPFAHT